VGNIKLPFTPFVLVWYLATGIVTLVTRFAAMLIGLILVVVGAALTLTLIGAIIGLPLVATGWHLMRHGLS
jgi:hypothetical protein